MTTASSDERLRRWRLILGGDQADGADVSLSKDDARMDAVLAALYGGENGGGKKSERSAGLGKSAPNVARWLGDIRSYFPSSVVKVMQKDAVDRLGLRQLLLEPELLQSVEPDVHLVGTLLSLGQVIPEKTKETARRVVRRVVEQLERKLSSPLRQAVLGSLNRASRNRRPRHSEIDWNRTIRANLKHYQPAYRTVVPETRIGFARRTSAQRDIILCVDQSGSMAASVVYSSVLAAVLVSLKAVRTSFIVFDTAVVDLTEKLADPVDVLFGTQLGGGTDINRAVAYGQSLIRNPSETIFVLVSDLYEGGVEKELLKRVASIVASGARMITLLALSDEGAPAFDRELAAKITALGSPSFACTPDLFPDLMAAAIQKGDIGLWAARNKIKVE
jgi:Mg-chelatase subunit ChlD